MKFTIYTANTKGVASNCLYPNQQIIETPEQLASALAWDNVCCLFKDDYRSKINILNSDCIVLDFDNDHSENPEEWITPEMIRDSLPDVSMAVAPSRNHMKPKNGKTPRPKGHVVFPIHETGDAEIIATLKRQIWELCPLFDQKCLDAPHFIYGAPMLAEDILWVEGTMTIEEYLHSEQDITPIIPEGGRNNYMYQYAVKRLKRHGNTPESETAFYKEAERCSPSLDDSELATIWRSATGFYERTIKTDPSYIPPGQYQKNNKEETENWVQPIPFGKYAIAPFPVDALPHDIGDYVAAVAESTQTPVDMAGTMALSVLSLCVQGKFQIMGKPDWIEPLNTYAINIAAPSDRKSAVAHLMLKVVNDYEVQYNQRNSARVKASKMRKHVLERTQRALEEQIVKGKADISEVEKIAQELADFKEEKLMQLYVDDITTEKLVSVLAENKGRAALISSEGGIFDTLAGIYTKNVNIDSFLKGYSGDPIRVDRIGRESESIMNPVLTIHLMVQPKVVSAVLGNPIFRGRGLTARFLYCLPHSMVGERRFHSESIPTSVKQRYEQKIIDLLEGDYPEKPETITLSKEAYQQLEAFAEDLEPKLVREYAAMSDWAGKCVGNTLRIAGLLCRAGVYRGYDFLDDPEALVVDGHTMGNAIRLGKYYLNHAQAAYDVLPEDGLYKKAAIIIRMALEKNLDRFDRRQAMRNCSTFKTVGDIQPVLDFLEDYGYLVQIPQKPTGTGRPPLPKYRVNPRAKEVFLS